MNLAENKFWDEPFEHDVRLEPTDEPVCPRCKLKRPERYGAGWRCGCCGYILYTTKTENDKTCPATTQGPGACTCFKTSQ